MLDFGLSVALLTPFRGDGTIDVDRLADHAQDLLSRGVQSVTLFGTTGEGPSVGTAERAGVLDTHIQRGVSGDQIILGICETATTNVRALIAEGARYGVHDFLLAPPFYFNGLDDDGLFRWHADILANTASEIKIILYNIPQVTDVTLSPALTGRLIEKFPGRIRAMKDSSGNWDSAQAFLKVPGLTTLVGDERLLHRAMQLGAGGAISGMANLYPERMRRIVDSAQEDPALSAKTSAVVSYPVIPAIKCLMAHRASTSDWFNIRAPLSPLRESDAAELIAAIAKVDEI